MDDGRDARRLIFRNVAGEVEPLPGPSPVSTPASPAPAARAGPAGWLVLLLAVATLVISAITLINGLGARKAVDETTKLAAVAEANSSVLAVLQRDLAATRAELHNQAAPPVTPEAEPRHRHHRAAATETTVASASTVANSPAP